MNSRHCDLNPPSPFALTGIEQQARHCFLEAGRNNLRAHECSGTERATRYSRKCFYVRRALQLDPRFEVVEVTTVESWGADRWLFGLRLRREPLIGVHIPLASDDPLCSVLLPRAHRRSA